MCSARRIDAGLSPDGGDAHPHAGGDATKQLGHSSPKVTEADLYPSQAPVINEARLIPEDRPPAAAGQTKVFLSDEGGRMRDDQTEVLRNLFTPGILPDDPWACRAVPVAGPARRDRARQPGANPRLYTPESGKLEGQIGYLPSEALDALAVFYLEHREAG